MGEEWILLDDADTIAPGRARQYPLPDGRWIALCRAADGTYYACDDACPHAGGPLGRGVVQDGCVVCPVHGWSFDLKSGLADPALPAMRLRLHEVRAEGGRVWVKPAESRPRSRDDDLIA